MPNKSHRIEHIDAWQVVVPGNPGMIDSPELGSFLDGTPWPERPVVLIEARFSDGITALGEIGRGHDPERVKTDLAALIGFEPQGLSLAHQPPAWRPHPPTGLLQHMPYPAWQSTSPLGFALETVLLDWTGKKLGCRAVDVLGGAVRQQVSVDYWCGRQTPSALAKTVEQAVARGFTGLKMKARLGDPTIEQVKTIKQVGGDDFGLTIDPMHQWHSVVYILPLLRALEPYAHRLKLEDPLPKEHPSQWRRLQEVTAIPLAWHARTMADMTNALENRCADGFNCATGIHGFLHQAHVCETLGLPCWQGTSIELGIAQAARLHAAAAAPSCVWPSDLVGALIREHTLTTWDWPYQNGHLPLPPGHGLGVELDRQALKHYTQAQMSFG